MTFFKNTPTMQHKIAERALLRVKSFVVQGLDVDWHEIDGLMAEFGVRVKSNGPELQAFLTPWASAPYFVNRIPDTIWKIHLDGTRVEVKNRHAGHSARRSVKFIHDVCFLCWSLLHLAYYGIVQTSGLPVRICDQCRSACNNPQSRIRWVKHEEWINHYNVYSILTV